MFARGFQRVGTRGASNRPRKAALRLAGAALTAAIVSGACGAAMATPSAWPSNSASPRPSASPWLSAWPSASPSNSPSASASRSSGVYATSAPGGFDTETGTAGVLSPAADGGTVAGSELNDFGLDLLRQLGSTGNLCASPASIALALAMVRQGAVGLTAAQMDNAMHDFGSAGQGAEIVALLHALQSQTTSVPVGLVDPEASPDATGKTPVVELNVANEVFSQKGMNLKPAYLDALSSEFGAGVGLLDYINDPEGARQAINRWANDATKGRIPEVLHPGDITPDIRIAIANAIYLKAGWSQPFDPSLTQPQPFTRADGSAVSVPTMAIESWLRYSAGAGYRAVDVPMGGHYGSLSMTVVVPDDMASFVSGLTAARLHAIDEASQTRDVSLTLPRFSAESRFNLSDVLKTLGMSALFDPATADLSGITSDQRLYISNVIHQANIDVVEEGTTASAVTVILGATTGGDPATPPPHVDFHVDKPFLYFVRETGTGAILFMGRISDPSPKS
jgi:serpin B